MNEWASKWKNVMNEWITSLTVYRLLLAQYLCHKVYDDKLVKG